MEFPQVEGDVPAQESKNNKKLAWAKIEVNLDLTCEERSSTYTLFKSQDQSKLRAKVPLLLSQEKYPVPKSSELDFDWLKEWLITSELILPGDSYNCILNRAIDSCHAAVYMVPQGDPGSDLMQMFMKFFATALFVDDTLEASDISSQDKEFLRVFPQTVGEIIKGKFGGPEEVEFGYPLVQPVLKAFFFCSEAARALIENFKVRITPFAVSTMETLDAMCQLLQLEEKEISEETFTYLRRYGVGFEPVIEVAALTMGVELEENIRNSLIFRRVLDLSCRIGSMANDLIGIKKDILEGNSNLVLFKASRRGLSVEEAYEEVENLIAGDASDLKLTCKQLKKVFPGNENVSSYLRILKQYLDGFIYWYSTNRSRYGDGWVNIKIMEG